MGGDGGGVVVRRCARREERERNRTSLFKLVRFDEVPGQDTWFVFEVPGLDTLNYYIKFISSFSNQVHLVHLKFFESSSSPNFFVQVFRIQVHLVLLKFFESSSSPNFFVQVFRIQVHPILFEFIFKFSFKFFEFRFQVFRIKFIY